jgi:hypothetical protein
MSYDHAQRLGAAHPNKATSRHGGNLDVAAFNSLRCYLKDAIDPKSNLPISPFWEHNKGVDLQQSKKRECLRIEAL